MRDAIQPRLEAGSTDVGRLEATGALNFLDLDDIVALDEGEPVDPRSIIHLPIVSLVALVTSWSAMALWFRIPAPEWVRAGVAGAFAILGLTTVVALFTRTRWRAIVAFVTAFAAVLVWWNTITPPLDGDWAPDVARQTTGTIEGDILTLSERARLRMALRPLLHRALGARRLRPLEA